jgi:hypothetical protein
MWRDKNEREIELKNTKNLTKKKSVDWTHMSPIFSHEIEI